MFQDAELVKDLTEITFSELDQEIKEQESLKEVKE